VQGEDLKLIRQIVASDGRKYTAGNIDRSRYDRLVDMGWLTPFKTNISDVEYQVTEKGRTASVANAHDWSHPPPGRDRAEGEEMKAKGEMTLPWTEAETRRLRTLARKKASAEDIAKSLGRHVGSVKKKARELGLILLKKVKAKRKWSPRPRGSGSEPRCSLGLAQLNEGDDMLQEIGKFRSQIISLQSVVLAADAPQAEGEEMTKTPGEFEPPKPVTKAQREARMAFRQVDAGKAMTEHETAQKAFAANRERLKSERLAREAAGPPVTAKEAKTKKAK
jgi:hypothetical protein